MGVKWVKGGGCGWKLPMNWEFDAMDKTAKLVLLVAVALAASTAATAAQVNSYVTFRVPEPELAENAGGILHHVSGEIVLLQMGWWACPVRLFVLTEGGIEARGIVWTRSSRCSC